MNVIYKMVGILPMMALAIAAQDSIDTAVVPLRGAVDADVAQMKRELRQVISQATVVGVRSAVMGPAVKGAPYSAMEVAANTQTLFDGTNINHKTETRVYRDSEGRIRRETADEVNIWDPVAGVSYTLDPKNQTARQMMMNSYFGPETSASGAGQAAGLNFAYVANGPTNVSTTLPPLRSEFIFRSVPEPMVMTKEVQKLAGKSESLGNQTIEGVNATGTRMTSTIEAGEIGNDRPIQIVSESWYSAELQTMVKSTHSDPRTGQETLDLINISRTEPSADLFQVPAGYQMVNRK
jgi:hypothetical protein